jgi:hypothetical protein
MRKARALVATLFATGLMAVVAVPSASAQQTGLVNVDISNVLNDNTVVANVTIPVTAAANICGVTVGVLAEIVDTGTRSCTSTANPNISLNNITRVQR